MFNESSKDWARDKPKLLSDWTARPFLIQWCSPIADKKILDLGCGEGYFTRRLIRSSDESPKHVEGLDISSEMIELAKINEDQRPRGISYSVGCATDFSAQLSNYDLITAVFVYNYTTVEEMHQSMKRVHDHMEVGGHFVFSLPHPVNPFIESGLDSFYFERSGGWFSGRDQTFEGKMAQGMALRSRSAAFTKPLRTYSTGCAMPALFTFLNFANSVSPTNFTPKTRTSLDHWWIFPFMSHSRSGSDVR